MQTISKEEAIPLIYFDLETKEYKVNEEAITILKGITSPLGIIGVAGMYRTGKSYLLNRIILNRCDGFNVGSTVNACTKGIWMWTVPLKGNTKDGEQINALVLDCEGMGGLDEDCRHDTILFTLMILLSSCFIYNSVGSIDETALTNLSVIINLTRHIQFQNEFDIDTTDDQSQEIFPELIWVLRDFALQLVDANGDQVTSTEYLDECLQEQSGFSDEIEEKNRIRRVFTEFFSKRECVTLVRPVLAEQQLQQLEKLEPTQLRLEFWEQCVQLRQRVLTMLQPKTLMGVPINGQIFSQMASKYVDQINKNDGVIEIQSQ